MKEFILKLYKKISRTANKENKIEIIEIKSSNELRMRLIRENLMRKTWKVNFRRKIYEILSEDVDFVVKMDKNKENINDIHQIEVDVKRTCPNEEISKKLIKMLIKFSNENGQIGYCQGMSDIGYHILCWFDDKNAYKIFSNVIIRREQMYKIDLDINN